MDPNIELIACECGTLMNVRRLEPELLPTTGGVCPDCHMHPVREVKRVERERAIAAFGVGRC